MKILIATDNFLPRKDGIARFLSEILPRLKQHEILIVAPAFPKGKKTFEGMKVIRLSIYNWKVGDFNPVKFSFSNYSAVKKAVKETDIVWSQTSGPIGIMATLAAKRYRKRQIAYVHSIEWELASMALAEYNIMRIPMYYITKRHTKWLYNKCRLVMVPDLELKELLSLNGIKRRKKIVHLGTDTKTFIPPKNKADAKTAIGIDPNMKVIGYCGRIGREKNLTTLLRAYVRLKNKMKDVVLLIVGDGIIHNIITTRKDIIHTGSVENVVPYLQAMDVYVLPSLTETSSLSTMEAMSCGIPVIATPVGLVKHYIKDKQNGFIFPKKNHMVLGLKLEWLLGNSGIRTEVGKQARKTIESQFTWDKTAERIDAFFSAVKP